MNKLILTAVIFFSFVNVAFCKDEITDEWLDSYYAECPYGDAVIINKKDKNDVTLVDCVNYNQNKMLWIAWVENAKGDKLEYEFSPFEYNVHTMDGLLSVEDIESERKINNMYVSSN